MSKKSPGTSDKYRSKTPEQALKILMDQCAKAEKSTWHIRQSLYRWGIQEEDQTDIINTLTTHKFIDDARYAVAFAREKAELSRWGIYKIRASLQQKNIAPLIIDQALQTIPMETLQGKLEELLLKKFRTVKAKSAYELKGKLLRYGTGLGFNYEEVSETVDRLMRETELEFPE